MIQYSTITNCVSIIQGLPYQEYGMGTYTGFYADPEAGQPSPNAVYYVHVVIAGMGNACSGQRAYIDLALPSNTTLAIDGTNKVRCYYDNVALPANECPQSLPSSSYNPGAYWIPSVDNAHANLWPIPLGRILEIQVPVRSSTALTNAALQAHVWALDGNSSPWLHPQQGVYVFSSSPTIFYSAPSTISITVNSAYSVGYLYNYGIGGNGYFDLGTTTSYGLFTDGPAAIHFWQSRHRLESLDRLGAVRVTARYAVSLALAVRGQQRPDLHRGRSDIPHLAGWPRHRRQRRDGQLHRGGVQQRPGDRERDSL